MKDLTSNQLSWVERRYSDVLAHDPSGFIWDALAAQVQAMPPAELTERLAEMDDAGPIYAGAATPCAIAGYNPPYMENTI